MQVITLWVVLSGILTTGWCSEYYVELTSNAPVVSGGTVKFKAKLFYGNNLASGSFRFTWRDNAVPTHEREIDSESPHDEWSVNYTRANNPPGPYVMQVTVYKFYVIPFVLTSQRLSFTLTESLNGELEIQQRNQTIESKFVSNSSVAYHKILLKDSDLEYLNNSATQVLTYWFLDCKYIAVSTDYQLQWNYSSVDITHQVDAFVIADFTPLPTEPPTSTTSTTTTPTTTTTKKSKSKRDLQLITNIKNESDIIYSKHTKFINTTGLLKMSFPFICNNHTLIPVGPDTVYGLFSRQLVAKEPVNKVSVQGNNWIQRSEILELSVSCNGSASFEYCYMFMDGIYNVTGNETCPSVERVSVCQFDIYRLFLMDYIDIHTIVVIIKNDVSKKIYPVTVTLYKVNKQAQLSVIVVPVGFSLMAIVFFIFGVAYYWQNRSRFTVEVADFNFGQNFGELEYKTFSDRLKEALANAFTRAPTPSGSSEGPVWPPENQNNKYDEMS